MRQVDERIEVLGSVAEELTLQTEHDEQFGGRGVTYALPVEADFVFLCTGRSRELIAQVGHDDVLVLAVTRIDTVRGDVHRTTALAVHSGSEHPLVRCGRRAVVQHPGREIFAFLKTALVRYTGSEVRPLRPGKDGEQKGYPYVEDSPHDFKFMISNL